MSAIPFVFRPDMPRHTQIADVIRRDIVAGDLQSRHPIPSELQLQGEFGVARDTVRKAVTILRDQGYIRTVKGMGSFVTDSDEWPNELDLFASVICIAVTTESGTSSCVNECSAISRHDSCVNSLLIRRSTLLTL